MEYVNFNVALPVSVYLKLEEYAKENKLNKNEIAIFAIFHLLSIDNKNFKGKKIAGFHTLYNKNCRY